MTPESKSFSLVEESKICWDFWGFEQLSGTIDQQVMELQSGTKIAAHVRVFDTKLSYTGSKRLNQSVK